MPEYEALCPAPPRTPRKRTNARRAKKAAHTIRSPETNRSSATNQTASGHTLSQSLRTSNVQTSDSVESAAHEPAQGGPRCGGEWRPSIDAGAGYGEPPAKPTPSPAKSQSRHRSKGKGKCRAKASGCDQNIAKPSHGAPCPTAHVQPSAGVPSLSESPETLEWKAGGVRSVRLSASQDDAWPPCSPCSNCGSFGAAVRWQRVDDGGCGASIRHEYLDFPQQAPFAGDYAIGSLGKFSGECCRAVLDRGERDETFTPEAIVEVISDNEDAFRDHRGYSNLCFERYYACSGCDDSYGDESYSEFSNIRPKIIEIIEGRNQLVDSDLQVNNNSIDRSDTPASDDGGERRSRAGVAASNSPLVGFNHMQSCRPPPGFPASPPIADMPPTLLGCNGDLQSPRHSLGDDADEQHWTYHRTHELVAERRAASGLRGATATEWKASDEAALSCSWQEPLSSAVGGPQKLGTTAQRIVDAQQPPQRLPEDERISADYCRVTTAYGREQATVKGPGGSPHAREPTDIDAPHSTRTGSDRENQHGELLNRRHYGQNDIDMAANFLAIEPGDDPGLWACKAMSLVVQCAFQATTGTFHSVPAGLRYNGPPPLHRNSSQKAAASAVTGRAPLNVVSASPVTTSSQPAAVPSKPTSARSAIPEASSKWAAHETSAKYAAHETSAKYAAHETSAKSAAHETSAKSAAHETSAKSAAYEKSEKLAAHETSAKSAAHEASAKSAAYEKSEKLAAHETSAKSAAPAPHSGLTKDITHAAAVPTVGGRSETSPESWLPVPLPIEGNRSVVQTSKVVYDIHSNGNYADVENNPIGRCAVAGLENRHFFPTGSSHIGQPGSECDGLESENARPVQRYCVRADCSFVSMTSAVEIGTPSPGLPPGTKRNSRDVAASQQSGTVKRGVNVALRSFIDQESKAECPAKRPERVSDGEDMNFIVTRGGNNTAADSKAAANAPVTSSKAAPPLSVGLSTAPIPWTLMKDTPATYRVYACGDEVEITHDPAHSNFAAAASPSGAAASPSAGPTVQPANESANKVAPQASRPADGKPIEQNVAAGKPSGANEQTATAPSKGLLLGSALKCDPTKPEDKQRNYADAGKDMPAAMAAAPGSAAMQQHSEACGKETVAEKNAPAAAATGQKSVKATSFAADLNDSRSGRTAMAVAPAAPIVTKAGSAAENGSTLSQRKFVPEEYVPLKTTVAKYPVSPPIPPALMQDDSGPGQASSPDQLRHVKEGSVTRPATPPPPPPPPSGEKNKPSTTTAAAAAQSTAAPAAGVTAPTAAGGALATSARKSETPSLSADEDAKQFQLVRHRFKKGSVDQNEYRSDEDIARSPLGSVLQRSEKVSHSTNTSDRPKGSTGGAAKGGKDVPPQQQRPSGPALELQNRSSLDDPLAPRLSSNCAKRAGAAAAVDICEGCAATTKPGTSPPPPSTQPVALPGAQQPPMPPPDSRSPATRDGISE